MRTLVSLAVVCAVLACDSPASDATARPRSDIARRAEAPAPREFVVFTQDRIVIDRVEAPVPPPITVGSRASPETIASDDSSVVSIDATGALVAHRSGTASVRGIGTNSSLAVEVVPVRERSAAK